MKLQSMINKIENLQKHIDVEGIYIFGIEADRVAHFVLCFSFVLIFFRFRRGRWGIILGTVLIFAKEAVDLGVVLYYEPIPFRIWMDSFIDVALGFLGIGLGILVFVKLIRPKVGL